MKIIKAKQKKEAKEKVCIRCIVKRKGHTEEFDERKVYASCYAACLSAHMKPEEAEKVCEKVCKEIKKWVNDKPSVTSKQIHTETAKAIRKHDKNAAFMYETHKDIA